MIAVPTVKIISDKNKEAVAISSIGVGAAGAECSDVKKDKTEGSGDHVEGKVTYTTIPPSSGAHNGTPITVNARGFYTEKDAPAVEELVHNLEHGYTILWYLPSLGQVGVDEIKEIAENMREDTKYRKFIAVPVGHGGTRLLPERQAHRALALGREGGLPAVLRHRLRRGRPEVRRRSPRDRYAGAQHPLT